MKRTLRVLLVLLATLAGAAAQAPAPSFGEHFLDQALRIDLYQVGDAADESVTIHQIHAEGVWPESLTGLIPPFECGRYVLELRDVASNRLLFRRGFDSMLAEYKTTAPALAGEQRVFQRSVRVPMPRRPARFVVHKRDKRQLLHPIFDQVIDPADYHILREQPGAGDWLHDVRISGDPHDKVDLVFVAEGYTAGDRDKFQGDAERMTDFLFSIEPYKHLADRFNVRCVFRASRERGVDEPRQRVYRDTVLNASFNAFDLDRYLLIEEDHRLHEIAGQVPYDAIVVLVDSSRYGGGSIALDYCVTTVDHARSREVFVHELGHSFAVLADEYYQSEVSYNDFYPKGVEPLEPNITALLDPSDVKWKDLLSPGVDVPTDYGKDRIEALQQEQQTQGKAADAALAAQIEAVRREYASLDDVVGVFEGAGYASKGLYRSMKYCIMIGNPKNEFCAVCQRAIARMIDFYSAGR